MARELHGSRSLSSQHIVYAAIDYVPICSRTLLYAGAKYQAAMGSDAPTAEHRLKLKLNRLDAAAEDVVDSHGPPSTDRRSDGYNTSSDGRSSRASTARGGGGIVSGAWGLPSTPQQLSERSNMRGSSFAASSCGGSSDRGGCDHAAATPCKRTPGSARSACGTARSGSMSTRRGKVVYTRDGRCIDSSSARLACFLALTWVTIMITNGHALCVPPCASFTVRSSEEAALIERVQGHSNLAPPSTSHPSVAKYIGDDGSSLIKDGEAKIAPKVMSITPRGPLVPKWQVEKHIEDSARRAFRRTHIDYSMLTPKASGTRQRSKVR
jgi:hypothetical protein